MLIATSCADLCWGQGARVRLTVLFLIRAVTNTQTTAHDPGCKVRNLINL